MSYELAKGQRLKTLHLTLHLTQTLTQTLTLNLTLTLTLTLTLRGGVFKGCTTLHMILTLIMATT